MKARAIFERTKRRFKRARSHIGFQIFLGYVVLGPVFLLLTLVIPELFVEEYKTVFAWGFAILGIFAVVMLATAAIAAVREEP